jgi:basic membrane protein A
VLLGGGGAAAPHATLFFHENSPVSALIEDGFDRAVTDFGLTPARVVAREPDSGVELVEVAADQDVVVEFSLATDVESVARTRPDTAFVVFDRPLAGPNITSISFAANEASYLAGAAAALASTTGTIGFIGGLDTPLIWEFHAGFEAGARAVDPDVRILAEYLGGPTDYDIGFVSPPHGAAAAGRMFEQGADVVFPAAGASGLGALEAAAERTQADRHLWVIGVDFDHFEGIVDLPGVVDYGAWRPHILTSVIKDYSTAVYEALRTVADRERLPSSLRLGLAERGVDLSYSGGFIDDLRPRLEALRAAIMRGEVDVPCRPTARPPTLDAPPWPCVEPGA